MSSRKKVTPILPPTPNVNMQQFTQNQNFVPLAAPGVGYQTPQSPLQQLQQPSYVQQPFVQQPFVQMPQPNFVPTIPQVQQPAYLMTGMRPAQGPTMAPNAHSFIPKPQSMMQPVMGQAPPQMQLAPQPVGMPLAPVPLGAKTPVAGSQESFMFRINIPAGMQLAPVGSSSPATQSSNSSESHSTSTEDEDEEEEIPTRRSKPTNGILSMIQLEPHQVDHYNRINAMLSKLFVVMDASMTGSGKTYVASMIAKERKLKLLVIAPVTVGSTWIDMIDTYSIPNLGMGSILSYDGLGGNIKRGVKNGLVTREDTLTEAGNITTSYKPTVDFDKLVREGILLVLDECQKVKNESSARYKAAKALVRRVNELGLKEKTPSRCMLLSATPIDKKEQLVNMLRLMGFIIDTKLYNTTDAGIEYLGLDNMLRWAKYMDLAKTTRFMAGRELVDTRKKAEDFVFALFLAVFKQNMMSIMPMQFLNAAKSIANLYLRMTDEEEKEYLAAVSQLQIAAKYDPISGLVIQDATNIGAIVKALNRIQRAKAPVVVRQVRKEIAKKLKDVNGNILTKKFCLFADFNDVIAIYMEQLKDLNPVQFNGQVSLGKRLDHLDEFQEPTDAIRVIVSNSEVGGIGVNMNDTTGLFPRYSYIMPNYKINELQQATGRTFRSGTIGVATIRLVYGMTHTGRENVETSIYNALQKKGEVMTSILQEQRAAGVLFPNEFPAEYEPDAAGTTQFPNIVAQAIPAVQVPRGFDYIG